MSYLRNKIQSAKRKRIIRKISKFRDMVNRKKKKLNKNITPQQEKKFAKIITDLTTLLFNVINFSPTGTAADTAAINNFEKSFDQIVIAQWGNLKTLLPSIWLVILKETWENLRHPSIKGLTIAKFLCFVLFFIFSWGLRESILTSSFDFTEGNFILNLMVWITPIYASLIQMRHETGTDPNGKKEIGFNFWGGIFALTAGFIGAYFIVGPVWWIPTVNTGWQDPLLLFGTELITAVFVCSGISVLRDTK